MRNALVPPGRLTTVALLAWRELRFRLGSAWFWLVASATCTMAWLYGLGFLSAFQTESVIVTTDPLLALNAGVVIFLGVVLGLRLAAAMAWEREHRTLEVLLTGPVGWSAIILAKFLVELAVLALLVLIYATYLALAQPLGEGVIGLSELQGLALIPAFALPVMALGLVVGAGLGTVRSAVVAFFVLLGLLAAIEVARGVLSVQTVDQMSLAGLYLRHALDLAAPVLRFVSPTTQLSLPVQSLAQQVPLNLVQAATALLQAGVLLLLAGGVGFLRGALR